MRFPRRGRFLPFISLLALLLILLGCTLNTGSIQSFAAGNDGKCQSNCKLGTGVQNVQVFVEPDASDRIITNAIAGAQQSVKLEIYLLTDRRIIAALEEAARRGVDTRVMLEPHPFGGGTPNKTLDQLNAAGVKAQTASSSFSLTHEKGMVIDEQTAYIMTANFTYSALGGSNTTKNREYGIIDGNQADIEAVSAIFDADWNRSDAQFNDANLVVSPVNARQDFESLIASAQTSLLIEAEEMQDSDIEQAMVAAVQRGVQVQVIVPQPRASGDSNSSGIAFIKQGGAQVREDTMLYMHAKMMVVDGQVAFVGSENISTASLDRNREVGILIADQAVLNTLQQTFQQDWQDSQAA